MKENNLLLKQKCVILSNKPIPEFYAENYLSETIVVINWSNKTKLF